VGRRRESRRAVIGGYVCFVRSRYGCLNEVENRVELEVLVDVAYHFFGLYEP